MSDENNSFLENLPKVKLYDKTTRAASMELQNLFLELADRNELTYTQRFLIIAELLEAQVRPCYKTERKRRK